MDTQILRASAYLALEIPFKSTKAETSTFIKHYGVAIAAKIDYGAYQ